VTVSPLCSTRTRMRPIQAPETLFKIHILLLVITYTVCFIVEHNSLRTFSGQYHCGQLSSPGQMSLWANVSGQMSLWANVFSANVFIGECISWQRSFLRKGLMGKRLMGKCRSEQMSSGQMSYHYFFYNTVQSPCQFYTNCKILPNVWQDQKMPPNCRPTEFSGIT
jgi:hypothetical protein